MKKYVLLSGTMLGFALNLDPAVAQPTGADAGGAIVGQVSSAASNNAVPEIIVRRISALWRLMRAMAVPFAATSV